MRRKVSPQIYANMTEDEQDWYAPDYLKYKVKKVRSYESCDLGFDHFMGWVEERKPVGEPYQYVLVDSFTHNLNVTMRLTRPLIIDSLNDSNVLMNRVLNGKEWGKNA